MASLKVRLDQRDQIRIGEFVADRVVEQVVSRVIDDLRSFLESKADAKIGHGVRVVSPAELRKRLGKSQKQIARLESLGDCPRRRQISPGRVGYFEHEIEGIPAEAVMVRDHRSLTREELSAKLSLERTTVTRLINDLPSRVNGRWYERDIDEWLLNRPQA